jgi:elongation factor Tu
VAVRHARGRELVAVIEIVSPGNKASRREFRDLLDKSVAMEKGVRFAVREGGKTIGSGAVTDIIQ